MRYTHILINETTGEVLREGFFSTHAAAGRAEELCCEQAHDAGDIRQPSYLVCAIERRVLATVEIRTERESYPDAPLGLTEPELPEAKPVRPEIDLPVAAAVADDEVPL